MDTPPDRLIARLRDLGVAYGREDSFKLGPRRLLGGRVLIGIEAATLDIGASLSLAMDMGMPDACRAVLLPYAAEANGVFFGFEHLGASWVCKVYLEFWDRVRRETLRTGSLAPQLLHLGVKWDTARPGRHDVARYDCHPLLDLRAILRRMAACYQGQDDAALCLVAQSIVQAGAARKPEGSMIYLEVSEEGNPRVSFDINLYKSGMLVADAAPQVREAAALFAVPATLIEEQLARLGHCPLGHLSSGIDRHGKAFLSIYGEARS